ncbi:MAG: sulfotransferase [Actinomycetota bacterium]
MTGGSSVDRHGAGVRRPFGGPLRGARADMVRARMARSIARSAPRFSERSLLPPPILIIGCGRSGTTLVAGLVGSHSHVAMFPGEANELWHPGLYPWHRADVDVPPFWLDENRFLALSNPSPLIPSVLGAFCLLSKHRRILTKSVMVCGILNRVVSMLPGVRIVEVVRNGLDVSRSYARKERAKIERYAGRYARWNITNTERELEALLLRHWARQVSSVDEARISGLEVLRVVYEELLVDPVHIVRGILNYVGLDDEGVDGGLLKQVRRGPRPPVLDSAPAIDPSSREVLCRLGYL